MYIQGFKESNALPVELSSPLAGNLQQLSAGDHVQVPRISFEPCALLFLLFSAIDPLQLSHYFGHDIYLRVIQIVDNHLQSGCTACISYLVVYMCSVTWLI